jgi:hypothetical protein
VTPGVPVDPVSRRPVPSPGPVPRGGVVVPRAALAPDVDRAERACVVATTTIRNPAAPSGSISGWLVGDGDVITANGGREWVPLMNAPT